MGIKIKSFFLILFNLGIAFSLFWYSHAKDLILGFFEKTVIFGIAALSFVGLIFLLVSFIQNLLGKKDWAAHLLSEWFHLKFTIDIFFILFLIIRLFFIQPFFVVGESMESSFHNNDFLLIEKFSFKLHPPKRGDVIVFFSVKDSSKIYIKRIIGLPKETIEIKNGNIIIYNSRYREGIKLQEPYLKENTQTLGWQKVLLGEGEFFVLGDNREPNKSSDSREWGPLPYKKIIGRVFFRLFPFQNLGIIKSPSYNLVFLLRSFNYLSK